MTITGRKLRTRRFTPTFGGNDASDTPISVVFLAPARGAMSRLQALRLEGVDALRQMRSAEEAERAVASGGDAVAAVVALGDSAAPLEAWTARIEAAQDQFARDHIVDVEGLQLDADDRDWMLGQLAEGAEAPRAGTSAERVAFIALLPALWAEVTQAVHDAGVLTTAQGKG